MVIGIHPPDQVPARAKRAMLAMGWVPSAVSNALRTRTPQLLGIPSAPLARHSALQPPGLLLVCAMLDT